MTVEEPATVPASMPASVPASMPAEEPAIDKAFAVPASEERLRRALEALRDRGHAVHLVDTPADARRLVLDLLPRDKSIFASVSETLRLSGIAADIDESGEFQSVRRQADSLGDDFEAKIRLGAAPDVVVGSLHAVTEDGSMVTASATGSQLGAYAAGAKQAIWVVGAQKVVPDLHTALRRVYTYSLPRESHRAQEAYGFPSMVGKILICEREANPDRGTVVLVREPIGF